MITIPFISQRRVVYAACHEYMDRMNGMMSDEGIRLRFIAAPVGYECVSARFTIQLLKDGCPDKPPREIGISVWL